MLTIFCNHPTLRLNGIPMFFHFDRQGKCEWFGGDLQGFVSHYNRELGTNYLRTECLDIRRTDGASSIAVADAG